MQDCDLTAARSTFLLLCLQHPFEYQLLQSGGGLREIDIAFGVGRDVMARSQNTGRLDRADHIEALAIDDGNSLVGACTHASAGRCTLTVSASPLLWLLLPICSTNFPSGVNFKYASSATGFSPARPDVGQLFPPIHTKPLWSIWIPCSRSGQSYPLPAPPQALMKLPAVSNTTIAGAAFPASSGLSVRGRCRSQTLSCASMAKLEASPSLNCGGSFGHAGSTSNTGTPRACVCGD